MNNVVEKSYRENQDAHFVFSNFFFFNHAICGIMQKNIVELGRPPMTIWHLCIPCWTSKAKNTDSEYVILISCPLKQWLHERTSLLHNTLIACLVVFFNMDVIGAI
jgi:hypothetical protein